MVRKIACAASLALTMLVPGGAATACEGADCPVPAESPAKVKPLDIAKFMREQAASTRVGERPTHHPAKTAAKPRPAVHRAAAARPKPAPLPTAAAASFASHGAPAVAVVASTEFNAIDGAAPAPAATSPFPSPFPPETVGAAPAAGPNVALVAAAEFNDIDRKADDISPASAAPATIAAAPAKVEATPAPTQVSWVQWLWSTVTGVFAALATAVRHLVHL